MTRRKRPARLARASAYYRLAAKADRAGDYGAGKHFRRIAERLVDALRRELAARKLRKP